MKTEVRYTIGIFWELFLLGKMSQVKQLICTEKECKAPLGVYKSRINTAKWINVAIIFFLAGGAVFISNKEIGKMLIGCGFVVALAGYFLIDVFGSGPIEQFENKVEILFNTFGDGMITLKIMIDPVVCIECTLVKAALVIRELEKGLRSSDDRLTARYQSDALHTLVDKALIIGYMKGATPATVYKRIWDELVPEHDKKTTA